MKIESQIKKVSVYKDRALIERIAKFELKKGENTIIFASLPQGIDNNSIQVSGGSQCVLLEIKPQNVHLDEINDEHKKAILDEIHELEDLIEELTDKTNNLAEEKALLQKLGNISAESPKKAIMPLLVHDKVNEMLEFYGQKLNQLDSELRNNKKESGKLEERLKILQDQKKAFNRHNLKMEKQILVRLHTNEDAEIVLKLSYVVMNASWRPVYDFRLDSEAKKLNISYKAVVTQQTGEKWENVILNLSTARPQISAIQPELNTWFVDIYHPKPVHLPKMKAAYRSVSEKEKKDLFEEEMDEMVMGAMAAPMPLAEATVETGATAFAFSIPGNQTIIDNGEEHQIGICTLNFDAQLEYNSVPKLSPFAYLTSCSTNTSEFPMLPGAVTVFLDNSFVSNSEIKLVAPNQEFKTSLGIDEAVQIDHKLVNKLLKDEGLFSKKSKLTYEFSTKISNHKKIECKIKVKDQIPLSQNQEIKVELLEPKYKENTPTFQKSDDGMLEWNFVINPGEQATAFLKFSLEYPKENAIIGLDI